MTRVYVACPLLACLLFSASLSAQQPDPAQPIPTLRATTRLVVVDVTVTDGKGHPVHNLTPEDFSLLENGKRQTLGHVEEHTPSTANQAPAVPRLPPGTFTNLAAAPPTGALDILLLDSLNTPIEDQPFVRQEIVKYLKSPLTGSPMAIFGLGSQLHLLQGFTSNPDVLRDAVNGKKFNPENSAILADQLARSTETAMVEDSIASVSSDQADFIVANYNQFLAERASYDLSLRVRVTLESLNALAHYLSGFPGRKNLIWFSGAFPLNVLPNGDLKYPFAAAIDMADEFRATSDLLAHSQVSVFPIDARGVEGIGDTNDPSFNNTNGLAAGLGGNGSQQSVLDQRTGSQSTMMLMAENTGGKAFVNTNDLRVATAKAIEAGSNYYTLAYTPADPNWQGDFRKLEVKLAKSGYTLSYRRGYFADDPNAPPTAKSDRSAHTFDAMRTAMLFGGPTPSEIVFSATVHPLTGTPDKKLAPGNQADSKTSGPYMTYDVIFKADANAIATTQSAGGRHVNVGFATYVYNDKGKLVNIAASRVETDIPEDRYASMLQAGIAYRQQISVPTTGEYFLRFGVDDRTSHRIGALEIPVHAVSGLKPLAVTSAP